MKKPYGFSFFSILSLLFFILSVNANANWINRGNKSSGSSEPNIQSSEKKDSLPEGVTQDWLNSLRDENGNKIIPENNTRRTGEIPEDPGGDAMQQKVFDGFITHSNFGYSVSSAGDVNGDGFDDIIVGAFGYNSSTGRAYIYFGGSIMNTVPDIVLTGLAANSYFGISVSTAGDVNGDGYSDVIVGAEGYSSNTGRAYIYFGGASMNNIADIILAGEAAGNNFGVSVSTAGDVNGDGYSDVIIGAQSYNSSTGRAYIFFGGSSMDNTADVIMTGEATNNQFGRSVSTAGDVNGDGYQDVIVGTPFYNSSTGRAYIFFGGNSMDNTADVTMTGQANDQFGMSVSTAGDVNGDGYSDVIGGANFYNSANGRAYIFFGGSSMDNTADVIMTGEATNNQFGISVSTAGDVNGDGYGDIIIGAESYNSSTGRAYIFLGGISMDNIADIILTGETAGNLFGESVSTAGDVNGDGYSDVLVGAYGFNTSTGRVYLFDYFMKNEIIPDISTTGEAANNNFGYSVSNAGDVNGDGYSDVIVGAWGFSSNSGKAYVYFGKESLDTIADVVMTAAGIYNFGASVSGAGDVNGDGYDDVIIGAPAHTSFRGRAYIYFGGSPMNSGLDVTFIGAASNNFFGSSVSTAGDVNGDGYSDVIVGANGNSSNRGRAYLYLGGSTVNNVADVIFAGEAVNNYFGISVSSAGDVNSDGYSDVIIGAKGFSSNRGKAYIFFGGNAMDSIPDVTATGEASNDNFGASVSSAGDVNHDGYADAIVGAYGHSSNAGKVYIFLGSILMDSVADITITGEAASDQLGISVSSAGDINRDGYSDVIAGADGTNSSTGAAYVYYGGLSMDNSADVMSKGTQTNEHFGYSVSSAGDVNGDGYPDIVVGGKGYNSNTGRASIYKGSVISAKPILVNVKDVPNDEGGKVQIKWAKSSREAYGFNSITNYLVYRSKPPGASGFQWEQVADIAAVNISFYKYIANTFSDSSSASNGSTYFLIKARNSNTGEYWDSNILNGRSIDNISPSSVSPFIASYSGTNIRLNWNKNSAADLLNYILFRSTSLTIDPHTETPLAIVTDSTYLDTSPLSGTYFYFIVAQDIHNNYSPVAVTESPNITVNLTMFIEGFYNPASDMQVSDTIQAYLRNTVSPYGVVDNAISTVSSGGISILKFSSAAGGTYYLVVTHRNSIETWSASGLILTPGSTVNYDLSTSSSQAYGNNMIQVDASPVRFAVYSGDVNQDGVINAIDVSAIDNDVFNFVSEYVASDVTGNNVTDASDLAIADNNAFNFVSKMRP